MDENEKKSERIDDLLSHNLRIIQSDEVFSFSMDAVLLARFAGIPQRGRSGSVYWQWGCPAVANDTNKSVY